MSADDRIRWHCRRGMLELDLVLHAFLERHLENLEPARMEAFRALLEHTDPELLDFVMGRDEPAGEAQREVLGLIRTSRQHDRINRSVTR